MLNTIYEQAKANRFVHKNFTQEKIALISQCNLIQLFIWLDESKIIYKKGIFRIAEREKYVVYKHLVYHHYNEETLPPFMALKEFFGLTFPQALYVLNYFYYKVSKSDIENYIQRKYIAPSKIAPVDKDIDLNYILKENRFLVKDDAHYCAKRTIAYLCNTRRIDKDIVLNFLTQGFIKMDIDYNLCFITYKDASLKNDVIAITKKGTLGKEYKCNIVKEHNTGFFYAPKAAIENEEFTSIYVFESIVDLMSFLTLIKTGKIVLPKEEVNCFISMNGASNKKYLEKILNKYHSLEKIIFCLDNDTAGINAVKNITKDYAVGVIGVPPNLETVYSYDFFDARKILKDISYNLGYCKDWNNVLAIDKKFDYKVSDYKL